MTEVLTDPRHHLQASANDLDGVIDVAASEAIASVVAAAFGYGIGAEEDAQQMSAVQH